MASALPRPLRSLLDAAKFYLAGVWTRINEVPVFIWAQAIAFKVLVTILPLILLATGVFGMVMKQENPFDAVAGYLRTFLPPGQSETLVELLFQVQDASSAITIFGSVFLLVTVITLFSALRYVIATAVRNEPDYRPLLGGYVFDLRMTAQVSLLFLLSFALTFSLNYVSAASTEVLAGWGFDPDFLKRGWGLVLRLVSLLVPYAISVLMFVQLYYFIPQPSPSSRSAFFGAASSAVLFELAKNGFTIYATYTSTFSRYSETSVPAAAADATARAAFDATEPALGGLGNVFGVLLAFVFWVYFSGLVLIIGAIMTGLHERRNHPGRSRIRAFFRGLFGKEAEDEETVEPDGPSLDARAPDARAAASAPPTGDGAPPSLPRTSAS
ncbi:MAG: YihY/virulence factor BrkB family protein [Bacteroidota bacterium]